jgi:hypothetical protein
MNQPTNYLNLSPQQELLDRVNKMVRGEDPGRPINWPGIEGFIESLRRG